MVSSIGQKSFYERRGTAILVIAVALVPLIVWGVFEAIRSNSNDVRDWLPADYPETQQYRWFTRHFGVQDFIVASWPDCTLDDRKLDEFARNLSELAGRDKDGSPFARVLTGRSLVEKLCAPPVSLSQELAISRLRGSVIGPDGRHTCAVMTLHDGAARRLEPAMELIRQAAERAGVRREEVRLGGIPVVNAALNEESTRSLVRLAGVSGFLGLVIAWLCFRDLRLTMLVLAVGVYSAAASLAVVPLVGRPLNAVLITMVPLVYVTAVSGAIHLSNYYLDALQHGSRRRAPGNAVAHAAVPLLLAASTTVLGLLSLGYSDLNPIRMFGVFSAVGVVLGSAAQFLVLPAALAVWMPRVTRPLSTVKVEANPSHLTLWPKLGEWVTAHAGIVVTVCLIATGAGVVGLLQTRTSIQMFRLFSRSTPVVPMTRWLEERLGATIPLEVIVRFRPESETTVVERMRLVAAIHARLRVVPAASGCLSAATFAPPEVYRSARESVVRRAVINSRLKSRYAIFHEYGWIARDGDEEMWRISLRVRGIDDLDYAALVGTLQSHIQPVQEQFERFGVSRAGVDLVITGTAPIVFKARQSLLDGMLFGLGTDVALIVIGVILTTRSWLTGGVMFLLSIFPTALVFGCMGLLGVFVDIGSVMTPCVAVGVTVDDVIHFILCHRRGVEQGLTGPHAAIVAYRTCGRAIFQSWCIIGIGLAAFAMSSFVPTFRFGLLMLLLLTAGMVGNLLLLPSLLAGPVGRWIARSPTPLATLVHLAGAPDPKDPTDD
jgi:predicted RND superfamily exporter protein